MIETALRDPQKFKARVERERVVSEGASAIKCC
jgi:hypothetical protein